MMKRNAIPSESLIAERSKANRSSLIGCWRRYGFTLTELMFAMFVASLAGTMFFTMTRTWGIIRNRATVQAELQSEGRAAQEQILRAIRENMVGLEAVRYSGDDFEEALVILSDSDNDGVGDSLMGWGIRELDDDGDGNQDSVDTDRDGVSETRLWSLVELTSEGTDLTNASWSVAVLCDSITAPWSTSEGVHVYRPFEFMGNDMDLDLGIDGVIATSDSGEGDGIISEVEIGNLANGNGAIDHAAEEVKVATIGIGIRLLKQSTYKDVESFIVYQGVAAPRNWTRTEG